MHGRAARLGGDATTPSGLAVLSTEKTSILKLPLKPPQNATDVITIVTFNRPYTCDPDASLHR